MTKSKKDTPETTETVQPETPIDSVKTFFFQLFSVFFVSLLIFVMGVSFKVSIPIIASLAMGLPTLFVLFAWGIKSLKREKRAAAMGLFMSFMLPLFFGLAYIITQITEGNDSDTSSLSQGQSPDQEWRAERRKKSIAVMLKALFDKKKGTQLIDIRVIEATAKSNPLAGYPFLPAFKKLALTDPSWSVRIAAAKALATIDTKRKPFAIPILMSALKQKNSKVQQEAAILLAQIAPERVGPYLSLIIAALKENKHYFGIWTSIRVEAAKTLQNLGSKARSAVPTLLQTVKDKDVYVRKASALALAEIAPNLAKPTISSLLEVLQFEKVEDFQEKDKRKAQESAAEALGRLGSQASSAVPKLLAVLNKTPKKGRYETLRRNIVVALGKIGPASEKAVPTLIETLKAKAKPGSKSQGAAGLILNVASTVLDIRVAAAEALGGIGPKARAALSSLRKALQAQSAALQVAAAQALPKIDSSTRPECLKTLVFVLTKRKGFANFISRTRAIKAMVKSYPKAKAVVPALFQALEDKVSNVRLQSLVGLNQLKPGHPKVKKALVKALSDPSSFVRERAKLLLGRKGTAKQKKPMSSDNKKALPVINNMWKENYNWMGITSSKVIIVSNTRIRQIRGAKASAPTLFRYFDGEKLYISSSVFIYLDRIKATFAERKAVVKAIMAYAYGAKAFVDMGAGQEKSALDSVIMSKKVVPNHQLESLFELAEAIMVQKEMTNISSLIARATKASKRTPAVKIHPMIFNFRDYRKIVKAKANHFKVRPRRRNKGNFHDDLLSEMLKRTRGLPKITKAYASAKTSVQAKNLYRVCKTKFTTNACGGNNSEEYFKQMVLFLRFTVQNADFNEHINLHP